MKQYQPRPASPEEARLFYHMTPAEDAALGCIGHVRMDFGHRGKEFWHTWWPRGPEEWNSQEFKEELGTVVDTLRETVLRDLSSMQHYCCEHGGQIPGGICTQNHGYIVETENYRYCLRCNPIPGDYQAYLTCFDKRVQAMNQAPKEPIGCVRYANGEEIYYTEVDEYLKAVKEELPNHTVTGFRCLTLTRDPKVRKAVDDIRWDLYGEVNPHPLEEYEANEPTQQQVQSM